MSIAVRCSAVHIIRLIIISPVLRFIFFSLFLFFFFFYIICVKLSFFIKLMVITLRYSKTLSQFRKQFSNFMFFRLK